MMEELRLSTTCLMDWVSSSQPRTSIFVLNVASEVTRPCAQWPTNSPCCSVPWFPNAPCCSAPCFLSVHPASCFQRLSTAPRPVPRVPSCGFQVLRAIVWFPNAPCPHAVSKGSSPLMWFPNAPRHSVVSRCSGSSTAIQQPHLEPTSFFSIPC